MRMNRTGKIIRVIAYYDLQGSRSLYGISMPVLCNLKWRKSMADMPNALLGGTPRGFNSTSLLVCSKTMVGKSRSSNAMARELPITNGRLNLAYISRAGG
jgi:hypothetical protein